MKRTAFGRWRAWAWAGLAVAGVAVGLGSWLLLDTRLDPPARGLDLDGDGRLSASEVGMPLRARFTELDPDGSGQVDGAELRRHLLRRWWRGALAAPDPAAGETGAGILDARMAAAVEWGDLDGVAMVVLRGGEVIHRGAAGDLTPARPLAVGELGAWPTAAVLACLQARGDLDLAAPLGTGFRGRVPDAWRDRSLAGLLTHTAGVSAAPVATGSAAPERSARIIMATEMLTTNESTFRPSPRGLQVAVGLAEAATGRSWRRLSVECIQWPLSLESWRWTDATGRVPVATDPGAGAVDIATGLVSSADDYARFVGMLQQRGRFDGVPSLPAALVAYLEQVRTAQVTTMERPAAIDPAWGHAAGVWCETNAPGPCRRLLAVSSTGALAWLDRDTGLAGVILVLDHWPRVAAWALGMRALAQEALSVAPEAPSVAPEALSVAPDAT